MTVHSPPTTSTDGCADPRLERLMARSAERRCGLEPPVRGDAVPFPPPPAAGTNADGGSRPGGRRPTPPESDGGRDAHPGRHTAKRKRNHPARGSRRAALALSVGTTLGLAGYFHHLDAAAGTDLTVGTDTAASTSATSTGTTSDAGSSSTAAGDAATGGSNAATAASASNATSDAVSGTSSTGLADGTYTGDAIPNRWGTVQVQITVADGAISDVGILQYPSGDRRSSQISSRALPQLIQETLSAQSADVDSVSGATYTSTSYEQSLQTAIDAARAAELASA